MTRLYAAFTDGKFSEVKDSADTLFALIPLCCASTREEADTVKGILAAAAQYKLAVACVQGSRAGGEGAGEAKRQVELAAYATHCTLEPNHAILVLNLALTHAFKHKNFIHAAGFARRLIELPEAGNAKNATFVNKVSSSSRNKRTATPSAVLLSS